MSKPWPFAVLVAADTFFLWMFFAADGISAMAARGEVAAASRAVAVEWRHGMIGGWPFYMPGFFGLTMAIAWWSRSGPWRRLLLARIAALVAAAIIAAWLTPLAIPWIERLAVDRVGTGALKTPVLTWSTVARGWFTVGAWSVFVSLGVFAVQRRRPAALLGAIPGFVTLHLTRSGEAGALAQSWATRAGAGELEAWLTLALIPVTAWGVVVLALSGRKASPA
jgi:hypothetical protein